MTRKQQILIRRHGTIGEFIVAVNKCLGDISLREAEQAIFKYDKELREAGQFQELAGEKKIVKTVADALLWKEEHEFARVGLTNGCFDILHPGHIQFLREARSQCDYLMVLLNSNESVQELKGNGRPINHEVHRACVLSALEMVDMVFVFGDKRITHWLYKFKPNVWFKGGDYTLKTLDQKEVEAARYTKSQITIIKQRSLVSTTRIYEKICRAEKMDKGHRSPKIRPGKLPGPRKIRSV